jgi:hypothetical protein
MPAASGLKGVRLHPMRRIEEIKSTLSDGEDGAAEIRAAARELEASEPLAAILAALAEEEFPAALIAHAEGAPEATERAWLTLAAAGPRRARQVLAWRAGLLLSPAELVEACLSRRPRAEHERRARRAADPEAAAAWGLLAHLRARELRAMVRARPATAGAYRRARSAARRRSSAPAPLAELGALRLG